MKKFKQTAFLMIFLCLLSLFCQFFLVLPVFIPTQACIGQLEQLVFSQLKVPVDIGDKSVAQEFTVASSLTSLFTDTKLISSVIVDQLSIQKGFLDVVAILCSIS